MTIVKICGITSVEDARAAADAGAEMLGFIFFPPSPRYVSAERALQILDGLGELRARVRAVGVFVNEPLDVVQAAMETAGLDLAQLHGKESVELLQAVGVRAFKTLQATDLDTA